MIRNVRWLAVALGAVLVLVLTGTAAADPAVPVRQISSDPYTNQDTQHRTQVEPDTFTYGGTVIAAFQSGRAFEGGGASNIGVSRSTNDGQTWTAGHLPSLTVNSTPAGSAVRATDPSVAYDSAHNVWMIASMLIPSLLISAWASKGGGGVVHRRG